MRGWLLAAVVLASLATASAAQAQSQVFRGHFDHGRNMTLRTKATGELREVVFKRWKAQCRETDYFFRASTVMRGGDITPRRFSGKDTYRDHQRKGDFDFTIEVAIRGRRVGPVRWVGTFRASATIRRDGHVVDRCPTPLLKWYARRRNVGGGTPGGASAGRHLSRSAYRSAVPGRSQPK